MLRYLPCGIMVSSRGFGASLTFKMAETSTDPSRFCALEITVNRFKKLWQVVCECQITLKSEKKCYCCIAFQYIGNSWNMI